MHIAVGLFVLCLFLLSIIPAHADTYVINNVGIGSINISLNEYGYDAEGNLIPFPYESQIIPGEKIDQIVRITNEADDAWIRIRADFDVSDMDGVSIDDSALTLSSSLWEKHGDYWYYTEPVARGEDVDFSKAISIPHDWTERQSHHQFLLTYTAEAVQIKNFTPDWSAEDPWFGTVIEVCVRDGVSIAQNGDSLFSVVYEGGAEGLVKSADDFFAEWGTLMPGDTVSGKVEIKNRYISPVSIYFRTETIADDNLIDKLTLKIDKDGTPIYNGPLSGTVKEILLGKFNKNQGCVLNYTLSVPAELNNPYALTTTKTKWIFRCVADMEGNSEDTGDPNAKRMKELKYIMIGGSVFVAALLVIISKTKGKGKKKDERIH